MHFGPTIDLSRVATVYLEVTNRCNLGCESCPRTHFHEDASAHDMPVHRVQMLLGQVPRGIRTVLHGLGEPLCHPDILGIIRLAKAHDHTTVFNTNAMLLDERNAVALIDAGHDDLRISIETPDPGLFVQLRPKGEHARIVDNVRRLLELRTQAGSKLPRVSMWMTAFRSYIHQLPELIRLAADIGADEVYLQRMVSFGAGTALMKESIFNDDDARISAILEESRNLASELGVHLDASGGEAPTTLTIEGTSADDDSSEQPWQECYRPFTTIYVRADGTMLPCCVAPFSSGDRIDDFILGNAYEAPLEDIWQGERYRSFRRAFHSREPWECCERCGSDWSL
ncbi:MAG: radical SAM protein [Planctomycetes bacterium]|nr:radical SAM protein [Planctomycetota bacterium]NOG53223.1 radical SAM protein [Planctomycetota bacterium]